jgi:hypothetical protein
MAKKSKRKVSSSVGTPVVTPDVEATPVAVTPARASFASRRTSTTTEFNPDYSYVIKDLKRIGVLAGTFFVILIALSFIL